MTVKMLKEIIAKLPDDTRVYADDASDGRMFGNNNEFLIVPYYNNMLVLQTRNDFEVAEGLDAWLNHVAEEYSTSDQDFWMEFYERGYVPEDFCTPDKIVWAKEQLEKYGLI